jgi:tRNA-splicing ligase RtcB
MSETTPAPIASWLAEPMDQKVAAAIERLRRTPDVRRVAVMPDVHLASDVCVGTVLATDRLLFPGAVGGDIGCGMLALAFDAQASTLGARRAVVGRLLAALRFAVPMIRRHRRRLVPYPDELRAETLSHGALEAVKRDAAALQLGTLGGGNHFVELQADAETDQLWLMVHSGSRAIGQAVRAHHLSHAQCVDGGMLALDASTTAGQAYVHDVAWARAYADANRRAIADAVVELLREHFDVRPIANSVISCDHNHVAREAHGGGGVGGAGEMLWVHRKGAMPADAGAAGVLPGSMGTMSFHVEGRGCGSALRSSAHGAGRAMSRNVARRTITARDVTREMAGAGVWFDPRLANALRDESPRAYKDVRAVLRAQHDLVRVTRTLQPVMVYKGGG